MQWQYIQRYNFLVTDLVIYLLNALIAICQSACETRLEKLRNKMHFLNRHTIFHTNFMTPELICSTADPKCSQHYFGSQHAYLFKRGTGT